MRWWYSSNISECRSKVRALGIQRRRRLSTEGEEEIVYKKRKELKSKSHNGGGWSSSAVHHHHIARRGLSRGCSLERLPFEAVRAHTLLRRQRVGVPRVRVVGKVRGRGNGGAVIDGVNHRQTGSRRHGRRGNRRNSGERPGSGCRCGCRSAGDLPRR